MHSNRIATLVLALGALVLSASSAGAQFRVGSIYNPDAGPRNPIADKTARRPGDLLTILVSEQQTVTQNSSADTQKSSSLDYALTSLDLFPDAFNPLPAVGSAKTQSFNGSGNFSKNGNFNARVTVIVVDTMPNGNLVVSGRREIVVDGETKLIEITGIVRRYDVRSDNSVLSESVGNARITYQGMGPLTKATERRGLSGKVYDAVDWLWPL